MTVVSLLLLLAASVPAPSDELTHDPLVLSFCRELARNASAERDREHGAFVVRAPEGMLYFVAWPPTGERDVLRWYGRFPRGTIAILHTHAAWIPAASKLDRRAAQASRIPVYVITPSGITRTTGGASEVVLEGDWVAPSR